jgi:enamine deaminase RidA (YjgF/YER057c/UK114 family)
MDDAAILARLAELGIELPPPPQPVAAYVPVRLSGTTAYVAGQVAMVEGELLHPGRVGETVSVEEARQAARRCALQALSALRGELGSFEGLVRISQVTVYVASGPSFAEHPQVANGASELLVDVLGEEGRHARVAVGVAALPLGACVEVAVTAEVA